jgi:hypothetical protein
VSQIPQILDWRDVHSGGRIAFMNSPYTNHAQPREQRKIEALLDKLAKAKPISAKPAPITHSQPVLGRTAHPRVFFST